MIQPFFCSRIGNIVLSFNRLIVNPGAANGLHAFRNGFLLHQPELVLHLQCAVVPGRGIPLVGIDLQPDIAPVILKTVHHGSFDHLIAGRIVDIGIFVCNGGIGHHRGVPRLLLDASLIRRQRLGRTRLGWRGAGLAVID